MRPTAPEVCGASFAFRDSVVEAALVAFLGRSSRGAAIALRVLLLFGWAIRLGTWAASDPRMPSLGGALITAAALLSCIGAVVNCIVQLATDRRFVLHERTKSSTHIWFLILAMVKLIGMSRIVKLQHTAAAMTLLFTLVACFDRLRLPVALRLHGLSLVSYGITQAVQLADHPAERDFVTEGKFLGLVLAGQAVSLTVAAVRELRARQRFLQMHPSERRQPLPRFWKALSRLVPAPRWPQGPA